MGFLKSILKKKRKNRVIAWFSIISLLFQVNGLFLPSLVLAEEPLVENPVFEEEIISPTPETTPEPDPTPTPAENLATVEETQENQSEPKISTDKPDYAPNELVKINGENFSPLINLTIKVTRPDGSVVVGDGSFTPGSDQVATNEEGKFEYYYQLNGIEGEYLAEAIFEGTVLATAVFTDCKPEEPDCDGSTKLESPGNSGTYSADFCLEKIVIKAGLGFFEYFEDTNDGCYSIDFSEDRRQFTWSKIGSGRDCKDISHIEIQFTCSCPSPTPTPEPVCGDGQVEGEEVCDLGGQNGLPCQPEYGQSCQYCTALCQWETVTGGFCGDGVLNETYEECDDGNNQDGDGCSAACLVEPGSITVIKDVVPDDFSFWDFTLTGPGDPGQANLGDGQSHQFSDLDPGSYTLSESSDPDYFTSVLCSNFTGGVSHSVSFELHPAEHVTCTFTNIKRPSCPYCGDGTQDPGEECDFGAENGVVCEPPYNGQCQYCTADCQLETLTDGFCGDGIWQEAYEECEGEFGVPAGSQCTSSCTLEKLPCPYCGDGNLDPGEECDDGNNVDGDGCSSDCLLEKSKIYGYKYRDIDDDGVWETGDGEEGIEGWEICLLPDGGDPTCTLTDPTGYFEFADLFPGSYTLAEENRPGWRQSQPAGDGATYAILLAAGLNLRYDFGNAPPADLKLTKTHDHPAGASFGDKVTFTLTLTIGDRTLSDVEVYDVLAYGLNYVSGSAQVDGVPLEPTVSGPTLTWNLGTRRAGSVITITYQVEISHDLQPACYVNLACARGHGSPTVLQTAIVDACVPVNPTTPSPDTDIKAPEVQSEVLGAATGSPTTLLVLSLLMIFAGLFLKSGAKMKKWFLFFLCLSILVPQSVWAEVAISLAGLPEYKTTDNFPVYYTALDTDKNPISAELYVRKDGGFDWRKVEDRPKTDLSGYFEVKGHDLDGDGKYFFYAQVNGITSNQINTTVDRTPPSVPQDYRKERVSPVAYKIHWKNPDEDDFAQTRIYASLEREFTAGGATQKADVGGNPDQEVDFIVSGLEADKEYYFVLRNFDKARNYSGLVGDLPESQALGEGTGGLPVGQPVSGEEQILTEGFVPSTQEGEEGQVLGGEGEGEFEEFLPEEDGFPWAWLIGGGVLVLFGYWFLKKK